MNLWQGTRLTVSVVVLLISSTFLVTAIADARNQVTLQSGEEFVLALVPMEKGDRIQYWYAASSEVTFSISRFGEDSLVAFLESTASSSFRAPQDGSYVVKVENPSPEAVTVSFDVSEIDSPYVAALLVASVAAVAAFLVLIAVFVAVRSRGYPPRGI